VRIHHYEGELVDKASESGVVRLNPEKLDQLDYLVAALKRHGIYLTTDLFVSRPVARSEVYEGETGPFPPDEYKLAVHVNDRAFASYQAFARALLGHLNPYTGLRYADDPALAWLGLVNEDNPGNFIAEVKGQLREDCQRAWNRWLAMRYPDRAELARALGSLPPDQDPARRSVPLPSPFDAAPRSVTLSIFLAELERDFFARTKKFLREEVRCDALLSDLSAWTNPVQLQATRTSFDYIDDHFYVDHPKFLDKPWSLPSRCENKSPVAAGAWGGRERAFTRLFGKPFTVTEFNYAGPGRFRGVGGILTGALASVQDWDGLWRFAYSHSRADLFTAGGMDYFDMVRDPLNLAAERASLCLFLRGDVPPAKRAVALTVKSAELLVPAATASNRTPPWHEVAWTTRVGWRLDGAKAEPGALYVPFAQAAPWQASAEGPIFALLRESGVLPEANRTDFRKMLLQSESGEVTIDAHQNTLTLDTPRTAGGFAPAGSRIVTRAGEFEVLETDATIWVSSLDGEPIRDSHRLLLTHFTDLQNSETRYADRSRQVLLAWGHLPHLVRAGRALVTLRLSHPGQAKVFALKMTGERSGEIPAQVGEDTLAVPVSVAANGQARMCYEIAVGPR